MSYLYRIKDWDEHFENNRTREMKQMAWLPLPVKLSGAGYVALMEMKNGPAIFGVWIALLELASQSSRRGELSRGNGAPLDEKLIANAIRMKEKLVREALSVLSGEKIAWLEAVESTTCESLPAGCLREQPQEGAGYLRSRTHDTHKTHEEVSVGVQELQDSDKGPDEPPPPKTTPPTKSPIPKPPNPNGLRRVTRDDLPAAVRDPLAEVLRSFAPRLPDPESDAQLLRTIASELDRAGMRPEDLATILKPKREALRQAKGWGLVIAVIETACRGKPLGPRRHPAGRILHPGEPGYDQATPIWSA